MLEDIGLSGPLEDLSEGVKDGDGALTIGIKRVSFFWDDSYTSIFLISP